MKTPYSIVLASAIEGVKKRPTLLIHFQVALFFGGLTTLVMDRGLGFFGRMLGIDLALQLTPSLSLVVLLLCLLVPVAIYMRFWSRIEEFLKSAFPTMLDEPLENFPKFFVSLFDKSIYDFLGEDDLKRLVPSALLLFLSYYASWIISLYIVDVVLFLTVGVSFLRMILEDPILVTVPFLTSVITSQFIEPWRSRETRGRRRVGVFGAALQPISIL